MTINATIIQDSVSLEGLRVTTFELEYPRFIHSELMTHRLFSRNAASSRAIPISAMNERVAHSPASPVHWGQNQPGMQANQELSESAQSVAKMHWRNAVLSAVSYSETLNAVGVHKQIANRVTEPFQIMKTIVTATEWDNWYYLRNHSDAQPEIHALAKIMYEEHQNSVPMLINSGEWHVPYVKRTRSNVGEMYYGNPGEYLSDGDARIISASCCAQVSYRKNDDSLEKAKSIYDRLINSTPMHASPVEHQATPMMFASKVGGGMHWEQGITHMDVRNNFWSGNFKGFIQFRQLIDS